MNELYVVFSVADTEYAIPARHVAQLESFQGKTQVPGTAKHVSGIVQVRGRVIPLVDLRQLFGHPPAEPTVDTRIIVAEVGERRVGLLVDRGREVLRVDEAQVQVTPELLEQRSQGFFGGLVQLGSRLIMLLDVHQVLGEEAIHERPREQLDSGLGSPAALPGHEPAGGGTRSQR